jgi:pilus assembly protein Flp/PilA
MLLISGIVKRMQMALGNEKGQGLVEYALILVLISIAVIGVMSTLEGGISAVFTKVNTSLTTAVGS